MDQLETEYGPFTNNEVTGKTAEEVYNEWLLNKDKPLEPTEVELLQEQIAIMQGALDFIIMNY
jgi:hypothetical protein